MKRCPTCNRTYNEEGLSFCLDDGTPLQDTGSSTSSSYNQATISFQQQPTSDSQSAPPSLAPPSLSQKTMLATPPVVPQDQSWAPPPPSYSQPPPSYTPPPAPKKRSALPWVIGIV